MSKAIEAIKIMDESITNTLTKFCWWTDKHFEKDSVWWVKVILFFIDPLLKMLLRLYFIENEYYSTLFILFCKDSLLNFSLFYLANKYVPPFQEVIANTQKSPNKNRVSAGMNAAKISIPISTPFLIVVLSFLPESSPGIIWVIVFSFELCLYLLCTEPIPPAIKRQKLEEKELQRLQFTHQKN